MSGLAHPARQFVVGESRLDGAARRALRNVSDADKATQHRASLASVGQPLSELGQTAHWNG
jgi:hypothetical protein